MTKEKTYRIFGLDLFRSFAILIVVKEHSSIFLEKIFTKTPNIILPTGSDLFIVLSGFLLGSHLIKTIEEKQSFNFSLLSNLLKRRWLRTLPNYFLFLIINIILVYFGLIKGELNRYIVTYFPLLQNFYKPYDFLFWESWFLTTIEWSYFIFILALFLLYSIKPLFFKLKFIILFSILFFVFFSIAYRFILSPKVIDYTYWDLYIRKTVLCRFDGLGLGFLSAFVKYYYQSFWNKYKNTSFIIGISILFFMINKYYDPTKYSPMTIAYYFTIIGISIVLLFPKLESLKNENIPFKPFAFISRVSFAMYLIHMPLLQILSNHFSHSNKTEAFFLYSIFWISLLLLSFLVYAFFEKPIMNLRRID